MITCLGLGLKNIYYRTNQSGGLIRLTGGDKSLWPLGL